MRPRILLSTVPAVLAVLALSGCGEEPDESAGADAVTLAPAAAPVTEGPATEDPADPPAFPEDVDAPAHGGQYTAVVLATGSQAELDASIASVADYGYTAGVSDVGCLAGLRETIDLPETALVSSLLFADRATALEFSDAYIAAEDGLMVGVADVTAYCLD